MGYGKGRFSPLAFFFETAYNAIMNKNDFPINSNWFRIKCRVSGRAELVKYLKELVDE